MSGYIAALPMYDWPECADETRALWQEIEDGLRANGIVDSIDYLRPSIGEGPDNLLADPRLLLSQTCWGPISSGVTPPLTILAQPDYSSFLGGDGPNYRSAIIAQGAGQNAAVPTSAGAVLPMEGLNGARFAFNGPTSLSGLMAVQEDYSIQTGDSNPFYKTPVVSGGHQRSIQMVAEGTADMAAVDCWTWALAVAHERSISDVHIAGWTAQRPGLPYVCHPGIEPKLVKIMREVLVGLGCFMPEKLTA